MIERILKIRMQIALQIIFSLFDEKVGPFTWVFYPKDIPKYTQSTVSSVTIDLFTYSKKISDELVIMSFPQAQVKKKGLVKLLDWKDSARRGGRREAAFRTKEMHFILEISFFFFSPLRVFISYKYST